MKHLFRITGLACCLLSLSLSPLLGEDKDPKISIVLGSADRLKEDLQLMLELNPPEQQKQWDVVRDYLDNVFLLGIDSERPVRFDIVNGDDTVMYRSSFPIANNDEFLENLELFGINLKRRTRTYYQLSNAYEGIMRIIDDYGVIGDRDAVPARGFDPIDDDLKNYLLDEDDNPKFDVGFILLNKEDTAKKRREEYGTVKEELMAAIKQKEDETKEEYELRRAVNSLQLDELARYVADPSEITIGWILDNKDSIGKLSLDLLPDKDSLLEKTVATVATDPSRFEALEPAEGNILNGKINLPLDEQQQENLVSIMELFRERGLTKIETAEDESDEQKEAFKKILTGLSNSMIETLKTGRLDGYITTHPTEGGKFTLQGGLVFQDASSAAQAIELIKVIRPERTVELNVAEQGGVKIHAFQASPDDKERMEAFYGSHIFHVGVGENEVWYAVGTDSLESIKSAVAKADEAKPESASSEFLSFYAKLTPWVDMRVKFPDPKEEEKVAEPEEPKDDPADGEEEEEEKKSLVDREKLGDYALEAFEPGHDEFVLSLSKDEKRILGSGKIDTDLLRLAGRLLAEFSKENLEE